MSTSKRLPFFLTHHIIIHKKTQRILWLEVNCCRHIASEEPYSHQLYKLNIWHCAIIKQMKNSTHTVFIYIYTIKQQTKNCTHTHFQTLLWWPAVRASLSPNVNIPPPRYCRQMNITMQLPPLFTRAGYTQRQSCESEWCSLSHRVFLNVHISVTDIRINCQFVLLLF